MNQSLLRESQYTARGLIEYVEMFEMPQNKLSRKQKWTTFFTNDPRGKVAYTCILSTNPGWDSGEFKIADRIASAYQFQSDPHHSSALEINSGVNFVVKQESMELQLFNVAKCLNSALSLQGKFVA